MVLRVWKTLIKVASPTWTCCRFASVVGVTLFLASCHLSDNPPKTMSMAAFKGDKRAVLRFLNKGEDVNARGQDGERPIHFSVYGDQRAMVELLLVKGADINATTDSGSTPLHGAAWKGHLAIAEYLVLNGAKTNPVNAMGKTPLDWAIEQNHSDVAELLRKHGGRRNDGERTASPPHRFDER